MCRSTTDWPLPRPHLKCTTDDRLRCHAPDQGAHAVDADLAASYERGYAGGLIFRQKDQQDISAQAILVTAPLAPTDMVQSRVG